MTIIKSAKTGIRSTKCKFCGSTGILDIKGTDRQSAIYSVSCTKCAHVSDEFCFVFKAWRHWTDINTEPKKTKANRPDESLWEPRVRKKKGEEKPVVLSSKVKNVPLFKAQAPKH